MFTPSMMELLQCSLHTNTTKLSLFSKATDSSPACVVTNNKCGHQQWCMYKRSVHSVNKEEVIKRDQYSEIPEYMEEKYRMTTTKKRKTVKCNNNGLHSHILIFYFKRLNFLLLIFNVSVLYCHTFYVHVFSY
jgi:hypothetical protein